MNPIIVGIRFQNIGKIYHFNASCCPDLKAGDFAIVETSRGVQLGEVAVIIDDPNKPREGTWKPIVRKATPRDLVLRQIRQKKEVEALVNCRAKAKEINIRGIKIVSAEFTFDGKRLTLLYNSEGEESIDLSQLRKAMKQIYPRIRIDIKQVGPRDVAKIIGGMGACGMDNRCCSKFLAEFRPISIRMAKAQGVSLAPSEITGMCGRLRCCLIYEYEQYVDARKELPKRNKRVKTSDGDGKVIDIYPLKDSVLVLLDGDTRKEFHREEIEPWNEHEALRRKAQQPCANGGCNGDGKKHK